MDDQSTAPRQVKVMQFFATTRAFTLLELLVSLSIVSVGVLGVGAISTLATRVARQSESRTMALSLARLTIDDLQNTSQGNRNVVTDAPITIPADIKAMFMGKTRATNVEGFYSVRPVNGSKNLQQLVVTIQWVNVTGQSVTNKASRVSLWRTVSSVQNMNWTPYDGSTVPGIDQLFFTPTPPPPPPPPAPPATPPTPTPPTPTPPVPTPPAPATPTPPGGGTTVTPPPPATTFTFGTTGSKWQ